MWKLLKINKLSTVFIAPCHKRNMKHRFVIFLVIAVLVVAATYSPSATFSVGGLQVDNNLTQANSRQQ